MLNVDVDEMSKLADVLVAVNDAIELVTSLTIQTGSPTGAINPELVAILGKLEVIEQHILNVRK